MPVTTRSRSRSTSGPPVKPPPPDNDSNSENMPQNSTSATVTTDTDVIVINGSVDSTNKPLNNDTTNQTQSNVKKSRKRRKRDFDDTDALHGPNKKQVIEVSNPDGTTKRIAKKTTNNESIDVDVDTNDGDNENRRLMRSVLTELKVMDTDSIFLNEDTSPQYTKVVHSPMHFALMEEKVNNGSYDNLSLQRGMLADILLLCRNTFKAYKSKSQPFELAAKVKPFAYSRLTKAPAFKPKPNSRSKSKKLSASAVSAISPAIGVSISASASTSSLLSIESNDSGDGLAKKRKRRKKRNVSYMEDPDNIYSGYGIASAVSPQSRVPTIRVLQSSGYQPIDDYVFVCDDEILSEKLKTSKRGCCDGGHCDTLEKLGPYSQMDEKWMSECSDRKRMMECSDECKCNADNCRNRAITRGEAKKLGTEVSERSVFGIDHYTHRQFITILPDEMVELMGDPKTKQEWIETRLLPAVNDYKEAVMNILPQFASKRPIDKVNQLHFAPFYITDVLRVMLYKAEQAQDIIQQQIISYVMLIILHLGKQMITDSGDFNIGRAKAEVNFQMCYSSEQLLEMYVSEEVLATGEGAVCDGEFPIYSKGTGVVCTSPSGIKTNEFVVQFLGEVYPPWCWYEKSDRVKYLEKSQGAEKQPEFFNMMLERHMDDDKGYDVVFIDPSKKGNYASRISHSCHPNCIALSMAVNGRFVIGVFAIRDIECGEELSFDYNSVTEDEKEWKSAICLCGMRQCRSWYLYYSGTGSYTEVLKTHHNFLHRSAAMFIAARNQPLTEAETALFVKYNVRQSAMDGIPDWMKKYAAQILTYIDLEQQMLPKILLDRAQSTDEYTETDAVNEVWGLKHVRLQTLVITLNKMKYFFRMSTNAQRIHIPPLTIFTPAQIVDHIWYSDTGLIKGFLDSVSYHLEKSDPLLIRVNAMKPTKDDKGLQQSTQYLCEIRDGLRKIAPTRFAYFHAAADTFDMYANTKYFFTSYPYDGFKSTVFTYRELGYSKAGKAQPKKYQSQYPWGQLNFWDRHTIESPDSSLSQMRRCTIALPNVDCCFTKSMHPIRRSFDLNTRKEMIEWLEDKPGNPFPTKWHWSFRNGKIYGSPWLDAYIDASEQPKLDKFYQNMRAAPVLYPGIDTALIIGPKRVIESIEPETVTSTSTVAPVSDAMEVDALSSNVCQSGVTVTEVDLDTDISALPQS